MQNQPNWKKTSVIDRRCKVEQESNRSRINPAITPDDTASKLTPLFNIWHTDRIENTADQVFIRCRKSTDT